MKYEYEEKRFVDKFVDPFGDPEFVHGYNEWLDSFWSPNKLSNFEAMLEYYRKLELYDNL